MSVVKAFNGLNGRVVTRPELEEIIAQAQKEEQPHVALRLSSILQKYEDESFEINVSQPEIECLPKSLINFIDQGDDLPDDSGGLGRAITGNDIYDMVTNQIIHNIENSGHLPWYHGRDRKGKDTYIDIPLPINYTTKKYYRGINALILGFYPKRNTKIPFVVDTEPITDGRLCWMTPKQIKENGGTIRKGAIAAKVVYYNWIYKNDKEVIDEPEYRRLMDKCRSKKKSDECKDVHKIPFLRYYNVINERDIEGIDFKAFWAKIKEKSGKQKIESEAEKISSAELVIANMPQRPQIIERNLTGGQFPHYSPGKDIVVMPQKEQYSNVALWYGTAFHELTHATGHASRLARPGITDFKGFGSPSYAFEEIVAELGSAFLNAESGIFFHTLKKNTAYIKGWKQKVIATLKDDNKAILKAAGAAQKAADFILNRDANGVPAFYGELEKKEIKVKPTPPAKQKKKEGEKSKRSIKKGAAKKAEKKTGNEAKKSEPKEETQTTKIFEIIKDYQAGKELNNDELKQVLINNLKEKNLKKGSYSHYAGVEIQQSEIPDGLFTPIRIQNKNPEQSLKIICSKDNLRPALTGIFVDKGKYVATDAHALVVLHTKTKKGDEGKILNINEKKSGQTGKYIEANYPKYEGVIPIYKNETGYIDINELLRITNTAIKLFYPLLGAQSIELEKDLLYNPSLLHKLLKVLAETGTKKVKLSAAPSRALKVVGDNKNFGIIMPLIPGDIAIFRTKPYLKGGMNIKAGLNGISNDLFKGLKAPTASKKKSFSSLLSAPIAVSQTTKGQHKTTKKTQPTKKRGLKSPVIPLLPDNQVQVQEETPVITSPPQATTENTAPVTPRPKSFLNAGHGENKFFDVPGEAGKFLQMVERKPVGSVVITIDGQQGAGKTTMLYRFMNDFAGGNNRCLFLSGEEHPESFLAIEKKNKYIDLENQGNIDIIDEVSTMRELYGWIEEYDIIFIDSWQKLQRMIGNIRLDEDLRKKFDGKVFIVIFQQTTTGRTKGGAEIVFDGDIIIKMQKEPVFTDNFAYFDKNRYTRVPLEQIRYNIAGGYVYNPCENDLTETTPPTPENLLIEIEEL